MSEAKPAPAIGYSIVANLGGDRQITVQCFVGEDESLTAINERIDRVLTVVDRQKARYEVETIVADIAKHRQTLLQGEEDLARQDEAYEAAQASLKERAGLLHGSIKDIEASAHANGRGGPAGAAKAQAANAHAEIKTIAGEMMKNTAERDQYRSNAVVSLERFRQAIVDGEARLSKAEALIAGG